MGSKIWLDDVVQASNTLQKMLELDPTISGLSVGSRHGGVLVLTRESNDDGRTMGWTLSSK